MWLYENKNAAEANEGSTDTCCAVTNQGRC